MDASPRVTILIPTYNRRDVLPRAISSALGQTFPDFELVVVDDGSSDGTAGLVEALGDPRIRLLCLDANQGVSRARNAGIRVARGELVAFLDSDDEWLPTKLERQVARLDAAADRRVRVVYCRCAGYDHAARRTLRHDRPLHEGDVFRDLLAGWHPPTASVVAVERAALTRVGGFDETMPYAEDYDLWLRLAQDSVHFVAVDEVLAIKHDRGGPQLSDDPAIRVRSRRLLTARWGPLVGRHLGPVAYRRWRARQSARIHATRYARVLDALAEGNRRTAWLQSVAMLRSLPWGTVPFRALALTMLGPRGYRALADVRAAVVSRINRRSK